MTEADRDNPSASSLPNWLPIIRFGAGQSQKQGTQPKCQGLKYMGHLLAAFAGTLAGSC